MKAALLTDRSVLRVTGEPARGFLNNLVTCDIEHLSPGDARYGALLTPQGKIIADFLVIDAGEDGFLIDVATALADELAQKLNFYKLRAKVTIARDNTLSVLADRRHQRERHHLCRPAPRRARPARHHADR